MRVKLVYPAWPRLRQQTPFILPPLGLAVVAGLTPPGHEVSLADENARPVDLDDHPDIVGIGAMLTCQLKRAFEIADRYRAKGVPVVLGGVAATCVADEARLHADAVVLGEAEGLWPRILADVSQGKLSAVYQRKEFASGLEIPSPRRDLLAGDEYSYRGLRMVDLVETARGCGLGCFPCVVGGFSGRGFRPRDLGAVAAELAAIPNDRIYVVDNALQQDETHERAVFSALKAAGKRWVGHCVSASPELALLAADCGCWYVYQAVVSLSDEFRRKAAVFHDHGIGVEATVLLGVDSHGPDIFRRMVDYLLEADVEIAEFTVQTPFPGTRLFDELKAAGRLLHQDWSRYNADEVVFQPARMTPQQLEEGCQWAWREFYGSDPQRARMARLLRRVLPGGTGYGEERV
ncbi:MAG: cobalamin B12-binding domain-containing protein [Elusimicrobia bacterium]|nr:cobalamin B12-binding domain-containing protein [Elusimicrobiota bacterium]